MLLFYVRHGDPIYNPDSLTELGHEQAEALVERMKICAPQRIFSSSSNRAILTATPTAKALGKEIEILDWCNERYTFHEMWYKPTEEARPQWLFGNAKKMEQMAAESVRVLGDKWYTHPNFADGTYGVGLERISRETDAFMLALGYRHDHQKNGYIAQEPPHQRVALFAHQGFGIAFLSQLLDIPYPLMCRFDLGHSSITAIEFADSGFTVPRVLQMSNDSHLFAADIETAYQNRIVF